MQGKEDFCGISCFLLPSYIVSSILEKSFHRMCIHGPNKVNDIA